MSCACTRLQQSTNDRTRHKIEVEAAACELGIDLSRSKSISDLTEASQWGSEGLTNKQVYRIHLPS